MNEKVVRLQLKEKPKHDWVEFIRPDGKRTLMVPGKRYIMLHKSGMYYYRREMKGKEPLFAPTGFKTIGKAVRRGEQMWQEHLNGTLRLKSHVRLVRDVSAELQEEYRNQYEAFQNEKKGKKISKRTLEGYLMLGALVDRIFGEKDIRDINNLFWKQWARDFKGIKTEVKRKFTRKNGEVEIVTVRISERKTLFDVHKYLTALLNYAADSGDIPGRITLDAPNDPKAVTPKIYSDAEKRSIENNFEPKYALAAVLLNDEGPRVNELCHLRWPDFEFLEHEGEPVAIMFLMTAKGGRSRAVILRGRTYEAVKEAYDKRDVDTPWVFPSLKDKLKPVSRGQMYKYWQRAAKMSGISGKAWVHWTRHTLNEKVYYGDRGRNLEVHSEQIGTSRKTIEQYYLKRRDRDQLRQRALNSLSVKREGGVK